MIGHQGHNGFLNSAGAKEWDFSFLQWIWIWDRKYMSTS